MEESKQNELLVTTQKASQITEQMVRDHLNIPDAKITLNTSPKGFLIEGINKDRVNELLEKGQDTLNNETINFAENDQYCTIFIKGITEDVKEGDLSSALSTEGRICMTSIPKDSNHKIKGTSFVRFNRKEDAIKAAKKYPKLTVNGVVMEISEFDEKARPVVNESITIKNLPNTFTEASLQEIFSQFGSIADVRYTDGQDTATIFYSTPGSVTKAVQSYNGKVFEDKMLIVSASDSEKKKVSTNYNNLYVGNVDPSTSEEELRETFSKYGEIESLLMPTRPLNKDGKSITIRKPYIYVSFKDSKAASDVIKEMDARSYWGRNLDINYYDPDRKRTNREKYSQPQAAAGQNMMQEFANAMMTVFSQMQLNSRGRGGYGGPPGGYRGTGGYNRGRGSNRGGPRGNTRGTRGATRGYTGGYGNVRSQYEKPMMGGPMGMPPMGGMAPPMSQPMPGASYGHSSNSMGQPPMPSGQPPMASSMPPMSSQQQPAQQDADDQNDDVLKLKIEEYDQNENEIGTFLYNKIEGTHGEEMAGRIVGMFLDLPANEIYEILHSDEVYRKYISDAENLIKTSAEEQEGE
jgi:RNA recognition motif-containing protein